MTNSLKFITFTDVHVSDSNPGSRIGDYRRDILDKLNQIKSAGERLGVDFFICAGDIFHIKKPSSNTHETVQELITLFKLFPAPVYCIPGNHDLINDRMDSLRSQPLGVLFESEALVHLTTEVLTIRGIKIKLVGFPFEEQPDLSTWEKFNREEADLSVSVIHVNATPAGGKFFNSKLYSYQEIGELQYDINVLGHYHIDQGIQVLNNLGYPQHFINVGAVSRGSLDEDSLTRIPKISLVTVSKEDGVISIKSQAAKLKVKPPEEIFDLKRKEDREEKIKATEEYVESLKQEASLNDTNKDSVNSALESSNLEEDILKKAKYFLDEADKIINAVR